MDRLFFDANVLFIAAYRKKSGLSRFWKLEGVRLFTSRYALEEARRNLTEEDQLTRLSQLTEKVQLTDEPSVDRPLPEGMKLPKKDRPILLAAIASGATHLITGDVTHFGAYRGQSIAGVTILRPAQYLNQRAR